MRSIGRVAATGVAVCLSLFGVVVTQVSAATVGCDPTALVTALAAVSGTGKSGTVTLTAGCTYSMTVVNNTQDGPNAFPDILGNVMVVGNGATITRATTAPAFRFFMVDDGGALNISNLTLSNGSIASGDLHGGAALLNRSTLTVTGVTFSGNQSMGSTGGGAIDNHDTGVLSVSRSTFTGNAGLQGGGIEDEATLCHTTTPVCGHATISQSTFTNNSTTQYGGGGFEAQLDGPNPAAICGPTWPQPTCQEAGGAHDTLVGDTFSGNTAITEGGGIASFGTMTVTNSTIYNNTAGTGGGGGVQNTGTLNIVQSTIAGNSAPNGANVHDFADSTHQPAATTLTMTIVSDGAGGGANCSGTNAMTDGGYNIDSGTSCGFATNALTDTDPMLGPLASNGGPTQTMALQSGSPAIDAIPSAVSGCSGSTDQRGVTRPQGPKCDIGAFEVDKTPPSVPTGLNTRTTTKPSVVLNWTASTDNVAVAGYDIYRNGSSTALATVSGSTLTYEDTAVQQTTTYSYTVDAFDAAGNYSAKSASASATTTALLFDAVSTQQYSLSNSDGVTWNDIDPSLLSFSFGAPGADTTLMLSANADLWTANAGYNQDIGIFVSDNGATDNLVGWKESGGGAGIDSPNAAFVQAVYLMQAGHTYVFKLKWKTNKPAAGVTIFSGAGPIGSSYSPTRLTAHILDAADVTSGVGTGQYALTGSDGATWVPMGQGTTDALTATIGDAPGASTAVVGGSSDLWTSNAGYNQDIGIFVSDNGGPDQLVGWKESGGFAAMSPNAAFVQGAWPLTAGHSYVFKLEWKSNKPDSGTIRAGAGPIAGVFSPTSITAVIVPNSNLATGATSNEQYSLTGSDGKTWQLLDPGNEVEATITPTGDGLVLVGASADLWTMSAGHNQDLAIMVTDVTAGTPAQLVVWKESGGREAAFSPNATFVQSPFQVIAGHTYVFSVWWKTNNSAPGATIKIGAGPIASAFSPTSITVQVPT
jgi:hypothetical protein